MNEDQAKRICKKLKSNLIGFSLLGAGAHNINYKIDTTKGPYVVRIENNDQFKNLKNEFNFLKNTKGKYGPKVFFFDSSKKIISNDYIVEEFITGKHPSKKVTDTFILDMARYYKRLHNNKIKLLKKSNPIKIFNGYSKRLYQKNKSSLNIKLLRSAEELYTRSINILTKNNHILEDQKYLNLIHGDSTRTNIYYTNKGIKQIDWEFVKYSIIEEELTFFVWSYELNNNKKKLFLMEYGYPGSKKYDLRFDICMLNHLWQMLAWKIERLNLIKNNKTRKGQKYTSKKDILKEIKQELGRIDDLLMKLASKKS